MESLCYSANNGSDDAYDVSTSLTETMGKLNKIVESTEQTSSANVLRTQTRTGRPITRFVHVCFARCFDDSHTLRLPPLSFGDSIAFPTADVIFRKTLLVGRMCTRPACSVSSWRCQWERPQLLANLCHKFAVTVPWQLCFLATS